MALTREEALRVQRRQLLALRRWLGAKQWKEYREWLKTEDPELYRLTRS
jgi:hypothetical protein